MLRKAKHPQLFRLFVITTITLSFTLLAAAALLGKTAANAADAKLFRPDIMISQANFTNSNSMSATDIQNFLNSKNSVCLKDYKGLALIDTNKNGQIEDWTTNERYGGPSGTQQMTAAELIKAASDTYGINPQVLLVTLQKEQGFILRTDCPQWRYNTAFGFGCPDTAPCDSSAYGFTRQLDNAAYHFKNYMTGRDAMGSNVYATHHVGPKDVRYNPSTSCGTSRVNIENKATASLYTYTPYQPNRAAINAGYGTGDDCSAYGNRNFFLYYTDWFGPTVEPPSYQWDPVSQNVYIDSSRTQNIPYNGTLTHGQTAYVTIKVRNSGNVTWGKNANLATSSPNDRISAFKDSTWISRNRVVSIQEDSVSPGGIATFNFAITAPKANGSHKEYFNVVLEGKAWTRDIGLYIPLNVNIARETTLYSDPARSRVIGTSSATAVRGSKVYATATIVNTSNSTLPANTALATTSPTDRDSPLRDSTWISKNRISTIGKPIAPGQSAKVNFTIQAPDAIDTMDEKLGLVVDGAGGGWIETDTLQFKLRTEERPLDTLAVNEGINYSINLMSHDKKLRLVLQSDGNLVLYSPTRAVWASNTVKSGANRLVLQSDGNLVLYSPTRAVWASNTSGQNK